MRSLAKLTPPRLSGAYPRQRLFESLDRRRVCPVVWINGPPGRGQDHLGVQLHQDAEAARHLVSNRRGRWRSRHLLPLPARSSAEQKDPAVAADAGISA